MTLSLDSNVLIDLANEREPSVRENFKAAVAAGERLATCSLCAYEFLYGAAVSRRPGLQRGIARAVLGQLQIVEFNEADAIAAAQLRATLKARGTPIGEFDALIAGQALGRGWTVVTANVREFTLVPALACLNWREAPESP